MFLNNYYHFPVDFTDEQVKRYFPAQLARQTSINPQKPYCITISKTFEVTISTLVSTKKKKMHSGTRTKQGKKI